MGIVDQLKSTEKGRLPYARKASANDLEVLLSQCSSSPELHISPKLSKSVRHLLDNSNHEESGSEKQDAEKSVPKLSREQDAEKSVPTSSREQSLADLEIESISSKSSEASGLELRRVCVKPRAALVTSPEFGRSQLAIQKYKEQQETKLQHAKYERQQKFERSRRSIEAEASRRLQELEQQAQASNLMRVQTVVLKNEAQVEEMIKSHRRLKETHEQRKQAHTACFQEAEQVRQRVKQEELRKRQALNRERQDQLTRSVHDLAALSTKIQELFTKCRHQDKVPESGRKLVAFIQTRAKEAETMCGKCRDAGEVTAGDMDECKNILDKCSNAYECARQIIDKAEVEGAREAEEAEKHKILQQKQLQQQQQDQQKQAAAAAAAARSTPVAQTAATAAALQGASLCVDVKAFQHYTELEIKLKKVEESIQILSTTPELKKLKFDIQKAVNTPINAISPVSGDHLRDKLKRLLALLSGHTVEISGRNVSLKTHPQAPLFCQNLIARMIVKKGEEQVSSRHDSAFAIAMVTAGLWREKPEIGDLFLAHFYARCPYIVPYYIPRQEGQSDKDYFISQGYKYDGDVVEKQDKFLKRMSGMMRLYFSILVSSPPRGTHPHGPERAWTWITRALNIEPEPDITTTMIYDFLQVTGHVLCKEYNKQFMKLLYVIVKQLLPKLQNLSSAAGGGALSRLQLLLENSLKNQGRIPEPEGYLDSSFWTS